MDEIIPPRPIKKISSGDDVPPPRRRKKEVEQLELGNIPKDWQNHWQGMPEFNQQDLKPIKSMQVHFKSMEDQRAFGELIGQKITDLTKSVWYPKIEIKQFKDKEYVQADDKKKVNPEYPVYIVSKGRSDTRLTAIALEEMGVPYHIVIEPQEYESYAAVIDADKIITLPFSNLGQGSIPARNWIWDHALSVNAARHWILDDNMAGFVRLNHNWKIICKTGAIFRAAEEFVDRYENVAIAGFNYRFLGCVFQNSQATPYLLNTRIYSCILIRNDLPYRWRGRYNEDTDLSLCALKDGWATVLFQAFLCNKKETMSMKGGNTESLYKLDQVDGRLLMAQSLQQQHPDVCKITRRWGRWQHYVDYSSFERNRLILKPDIKIPQGIDNFGMELRYKKKL